MTEGGGAESEMLEAENEEIGMGERREAESEKIAEGDGNAVGKGISAAKTENKPEIKTGGGGTVLDWKEADTGGEIESRKSTLHGMEEEEVKKIQPEDKNGEMATTTTIL